MPGAPTSRWSALSRGAKLLRLFHIAVAVGGSASFLYLWWCAISGRRDGLLVAAIVWLLGEGIALVLGRGNCPLGPLQERLGDPVPLFALILPPRAAKAAIPVLVVLTVVGLLVVLLTH